MSEVLVPGSVPADSAAGAADERRPPGDRYFRHPGDVVRLVLWGGATLLLAGFLAVATSTSQGVTTDLGRAATRVPESVRELVLGLVQAGALLVPLGAVIALVVQGRWRRLALLVGAGAAGAAVFALVDATLTLHRPIAGAVTGDTWLVSSDVPPLGYVAGAVAAATMGKPWLSRAWRRSLDVAVVVLAAAMAFAGTAGVPELALAITSGAAAGAALLVVFGAPNRRPSPAEVRTALQDAGVDVGALTLEAAPEGRAQRYTATTSDGEALFLKVYAQDARDADLLYRSYRSLLLRGPTDERPLASLAEDVEHQALLVMLAGRAQAPTPELRALARLPDGSAALALERVAGRRLDEVPADELDDAVLEAVWRGVAELHRARLAHRALRAGNILVADGRPTIVDLSFAEESADARLLAIDRAELLASLAALVGAQRAVDAAARVVDPDDLAAALAYLQPLALSAATRRAVSKSLLVEVRDRVAEVTGAEVPPLERLVRVQPRAVLTIVVLAGAFYLLLPQLADVNDSVRALRSAQWGWLGVCVVMSALTYVASAIGLTGGVPDRLPLVPTTHAALASSFVNRVTPANVGGMALNVRFMQKAGVESGAAVTGMGLNVLAGGIVHGVLLVVFFSWARQKTDGAFAIPSSSRLLVGIAVVLALVGIVLAVPKTRGLFTTHVGRLVRQSWTSLRQLARSPVSLAALFGGSFGVTLAYIGALSAAVVALGGDLTFAQIGAVYLGSSLIASAAPTPGGLGAMEAALVAGFTGVGLESGIAVAAVLSYRLATYWLPIVPGWLSFHLLERRNMI